MMLLHTLHASLVVVYNAPFIPEGNEWGMSLSNTNTELYMISCYGLGWAGLTRAAS